MLERFRIIPSRKFEDSFRFILYLRDLGSSLAGILRTNSVSASAMFQVLHTKVNINWIWQREKQIIYILSTTKDFDKFLLDSLRNKCSLDYPLKLKGNLGHWTRYHDINWQFIKLDNIYTFNHEIFQQISTRRSQK